MKIMEVCLDSNDMMVFRYGFWEKLGNFSIWMKSLLTFSETLLLELKESCTNTLPITFEMLLWRKCIYQTSLCTCCLGFIVMNCKIDEVAKSIYYDKMGLGVRQKVFCPTSLFLYNSKCFWGIGGLSLIQCINKTERLVG